MTLVSPGVETSVTDQSFYVPATAPTVPLMFVATQANKTQVDGITAASGTQEYGVVRTITSLGQSTQMYGIPYFWSDESGNQFHGDARNEYGLFALNQFLGIGNLAYVVRANIDTADAASVFYGVGTPVIGPVTQVSVGNGTFGSATVTSAFVRLDQISIVFTSPTAFTVQGETAGVIGDGTVGTAFTSNIANFTVTAGSTPFAAGDYFQFNLIYTPTTYTGTGTGTMTNLVPGASAVAEIVTVTFSSATAFTAVGSVSGALGSGTVGTTFTNSHISFLITAGTTAFVAGDIFHVTISQVNVFNPIGANDAARRTSIVTALNAQIVGNSDVRSEIYEYNLIVCPGYPEVVTNLLALVDDISGEAFVIADTPVTNNPEQTATWAVSDSRASDTNVAYYYPWGNSANLDGTNVVCAPSGIALRTYAFSDNASYVWFAPAGVGRGTVTGVNSVGYVSGTLGTATTYNQVNLNQGQRDNLYQSNTNINPITYFPGQGLIVWGQKTSPAAASALDRVNVVRLIAYLRRQLRKAGFPFVFEPNDVITRNNLKAAADSFLNDVMSKRGLYDFATLCDTSNNTDAVIENNQLILSVAISPIRAAEFIEIPITVDSVGNSTSAS